MINCDLVVYVIGCVFNIEYFNLEVVGVEYGCKGIKVSFYMWIINFVIFVVGDCVDSGFNLILVLVNEGWIVGKNLFVGKDECVVSYLLILSVVFMLL